MGLVVKDRVLETSTSSGTGDIALGGAYAGFRTFSSVCSVGDTCYYLIEAVDANGAPTGDWETGLGTYSAANTLTRTVVKASSNSGNAVNFVVGVKRISVASTADYLNLLTGGGMTLIQKTVTSSSATNVSFTSIPATYSGLQLKVFARGTKTATSVDMRVRFNGDTGNNYDLAFCQGGGDPANVAQLSPTPSPAALYIGDFAAASAPANIADSCSFDIFGYASTIFHKSMTGLVTHKKGNSSTLDIDVAFIAGWWRSTAAINQIDVFPSSGAFVDGSIIALYGVP